MKRIKYIAPVIFCIPMSTESGIMETVSQKTGGASVVDDGTELGSKESVSFFEDDAPTEKH